MRRHAALVSDGWLPLALVVLACAEVTWSYADHPAGRVALMSVLLPMAAVTFARRRSPVLVALAETVLVTVLVLAVQPSLSEQPPLSPFLALLTSLFNLGAHGEGPGFRAASLVVGAVLGALQVAALAAGQAAGDVIPSSIFLAGAFALGRVLHHTRSEARQERLRAELAERTREEHARAAAESERARIARELHDVVAHALTGIVVQASVEARLHAGESGTTLDTLRSIERQGRAAMVEVRRLLGLLREQGQGPADAPLPTLAAADALIEDLRRTGHEIDVARRGRLDDLPSGVDLAAYRILQEALTNVARHAPGSPIHVELCREAGTVHIRVDSERAAGLSPAIEGGGHGLVGMRERVRLYGGQLRAEAGADGGFILDALIPVAAEEGGSA
jgi:signal transduction histidine kinase